MTIEMGLATDEYLNQLKKSLTAPAVLKAELAAVKSSCNHARIFAYEGVNDKVIYSQWLSKCQPDLEYEPFICRNKDQLLKLLSSLRIDLTGMGENVYFFADRDFDDLKGNDPCSVIYMTEKYAVENYLVDKAVLNEILKIDFHCHGNSEIRERALTLFETIYDSFLEKTYDVNFRIYLARKCNIRQLNNLSIRLDDLVNLRLNSIQNGKGDLDQMVILENEPSETQIAEYKVSFDLLEPRDRYRGKFALQFFRKWLALLLADRKSGDSVLFCGLPQNDFVANGTFSFDHLAAKSKPPESFNQFISNIASSGREDVATA